MPTQPKCLILGAGAGNGAAIARKFGRGGYEVIVAARRKGEMERLVAILHGEGISAMPAVIDATDPAAVAKSVASLAPLEVLVYNAAGVTMATPTALTPAQLASDLTVSVVSALAAAQAAVPAMIAAKRGAILFTGGGFALQPLASMASLGIGKAAIRNLAFSLAEELRPNGIRVGTVTILGMVKPGTVFDPGRIADAFWQLHEDRSGHLGVELQFTGQA